MSKIGKISISIPEKVKAVLSGNVLNIEGPLGKKSLNVDLEMFNLNITEGKEISIKPKKVDKDSKRLWGMNRSLINNAVIGSSTGYEKTLMLVGVGYRAALNDKVSRRNQFLYCNVSPKISKGGISGVFITDGSYSAIPPRAGLILKAFPAASNAGPVAPPPDMLLQIFFSVCLG